MLEVGWSEMLVIAIVMIVVVGPKDLPAMLRTFGKTVSKLRSMAGDFQKQFNEALQEAELDDVKKSVETLREMNPGAQIRKHINPFEKAAADVRAGLDTMMKPQPAPKPPEPEAHPAEPLKTGAAAMPGIDQPASTPVAPAQQPTAPVAEAPKTQAKPARTASAPISPKPKVTAKPPPKPALKPLAKPAPKPVAKTAKKTAEKSA